ncbi:curli-like amyloid fiber formation chaperone CsgH [Pararhodobacter sp.]|uniref:curli-like amyloid fiber formation chaperone CsgH n=1 Tax=Pararhodobacter sp. TaxID=2127056 RepID=UPI002AFDEA66|nr:curli-like amyloid fiber formation chaperone CsgH [Pararhodobacter sp.]
MRALSSRRTPALIVGLTLAGFTAAACGIPASNAQTSNTDADAPVRCEISLEALSGGTMIEGRVSSRTAVTGTYAMAITSRSSGGTSTIRQSGDFEAAPGETATLSETRLMGSPASHSVDLEVRVNGRRLSCDQTNL